MREKCFGDVVGGGPISTRFGLLIFGNNSSGLAALRAHIPVHEPFTTSQNIPCIGQRQLPASVARSHAVLALARGYSLTDRIAPGDTARLRVGVLTGH